MWATGRLSAALAGTFEDVATLLGIDDCGWAKGVRDTPFSNYYQIRIASPNQRHNQRLGLPHLIHRYIYVTSHVAGRSSGSTTMTMGILIWW